MAAPNQVSIEQQLTDTLKQAMRDKDQSTADTVRMIKTKIMERRTSKGFTGTIDDAMVLEIIGAYRKQLQKAHEEFVKVGDKGAEHADALVHEIAFCERFLPKGLDEAALRALVQERMTALGITDMKQSGKLIGDIMKSHKGLVESNDIKRLAEEILKS